MLTTKDVKRIKSALIDELEMLKGNDAMYARGEEVAIKFALGLITGSEEINNHYGIKEDK